MIQVSLVGYAVGGAFLSLAYYDVPYNLLVVLVLTRMLVDKAIKTADHKKEAPTKPHLSAGKAGSQHAVSRTRFEPQMDTDKHG
jgi:hypothetical protein